MATQDTTSLHDPEKVPMIGWLTVVLAFSLPLYRPWVTLAATLVMLLWIFGGNLKSEVRRLRNHRLTLAIVVFVAFNLLSLVWSSDPAAGLRYVAKYRYLLLVPMVATAVSALFRKRAAAAFQIGAIASVALSAAVLLGALHLGDAHPGDPSATMAHLDYTLILAVCSLLALTRALYGAPSWSGRALWLSAFALTASGLLFNIGRSGQLGFVVGLGVLLLRWAFDASWRVFAATLVLAVVGVIAVWILAPPAVQRMSDARHELRAAVVDNDYQNNIGGRLAATVVAARIVREHPVLGTGAGANIPLLRHYLDTEFQGFKPAIYWYRHFHNQYAQIATELGVTGLASLGWIFWVLVRGPYRSRGLAAAASVVAAVYLVAFLGEPFFHKQIPLVAFALVTGLISGTQLDEEEDGTTHMVAADS